MARVLNILTYLLTYFRIIS